MVLLVIRQLQYIVFTGKLPALGFRFCFDKLWSTPHIFSRTNYPQYSKNFQTNCINSTLL
jgi:hypothetical protein